MSLKFLLAISVFGFCHLAFAASPLVPLTSLDIKEIFEKLSHKNAQTLTAELSGRSHSSLPCKIHLRLSDPSALTMSVIYSENGDIKMREKFTDETLSRKCSSIYGRGKVPQKSCSADFMGILKVFSNPTVLVALHKKNCSPTWKPENQSWDWENCKESKNFLTLDFSDPSASVVLINSDFACQVKF